MGRVYDKATNNGIQKMLALALALCTKLATNQCWRRCHASRWTRVSGELPAILVRAEENLWRKQLLVIYH